jgi:acyl carrier protein
MFLPCYGLAEATLMVSAGRWSGTSATDGPVSCGRPVSGQRVLVVDPDSETACGNEQEGEIWLAGVQVATGYWSGGCGELFGSLAGETFLRTGDRGYLKDGELFLTGRAKDVIVYRGVNYHAVDVESAALDLVGPIGGAAAAFLVDTEPQPLPVLILEVRGKADAQLAKSVRAAVLAQTGLALGLVALIAPRSVPRTSSGKVRRADCREAFLHGAFDNGVVDDPTRLAVVADRRCRTSATEQLTAVICGIAAGVCDGADCLPTDSLLELGVDSVRAAEMAAILEDALGLPVPLEAVLTAATPQGAANRLWERWLVEDGRPGALRDRIASLANGEEGF